MMRNEAALAITENVEPSATELMRSALEFHVAERYEIARDLYAQVLAQDPANAIAWHHLGLIEHVGGKHAAAAECIGKAVACKPNYAEAYANLTAVFRAAHKFEAALECAEKAIALDPSFAAAHSNFGNVLEDKGDLEAALAAYLEACRLDPFFIEAHTNAAEILRKCGRCAEALRICEAISANRPDAAMPHFCAGNILRDLSRPNELEAAYGRALALRPGFAEVHCNLGNILQHRGDLEGAVTAYGRAIALKPDMAEAHCNLGAAYETGRRISEAVDAYAKALALNPDLLGVRTQLSYLRRSACDWTHADEEMDLAERVARHQGPIPPFALLSMEISPAIYLHVARLWAGSMRAKPAFAHRRPEPGARGRLKIGYLSADFHRHATAHLMAELFERHDRTRFEIIAYSLGQDDRSEMRYRLGRAFDRFVDLHDLDDMNAARRINDDGIDILVELKGYTQHARSEIAAFRPVPIQVSFIGYPGTMGADFIDYIIADPITLPMDQQVFYDERIVHLPDCYQPNDSRRRVADKTPSRAGCGLPERGFVFCCFNNSYKITPKFFAIWMRLLAAVPGSVLWLFDANEFVRGNLQNEAENAGIDPQRLVFAPRTDVAEHLARQRLADLFLDTPPYNAHTTTSDALWVGLPVVSVIGETFAGRVAASLLHAIGLPELVTQSPPEYEALALRLALDPSLLADIRRKLSANRLTHPLFDCARTTRHLEAAFTRMWEIFTTGGAPESFAVAPIAAPTAATEPQTRISRRLYTACPLCDSPDHAPIIAADCTRHPSYRIELPPVVKWHACNCCGHIFTEGYFDDATFAPRPEDMLGHNMENGRRAAAPIVARVARHVGHPSDAARAWLDVDFGNGALLFAAAEWGFRAIGIDHRDANVTGLRQLGLEAHRGKIEDLVESGLLGVISFADVFQHLAFPGQALAAAHRLLQADGLLFVSLPNKDSMSFNLLHANGANPYWGEIGDCHLFGRARLSRLLGEHGFEPLEYNISERHRIGMEIIARRIG